MHRSIAVARFLLGHGDQQEHYFSPMKIIKLVYIAHGWMLGIYSRPLIQEDVEAWKYGPVIRELYREVKGFRGRSIPRDKLALSENEKDFDIEEKSVMTQTVGIYGRYGAIRLSQLTHAPGTPWDIIYNEIGRDFVIPNDLIENHYWNLYEIHGSNGSDE